MKEQYINQSIFNNIDSSREYFNINNFISSMNDLMLFNSTVNNISPNNSQFWWVNSWFYTYSSLISLTFVITIIFLVGLILPKTPRGVSTLNVLSAMSIILFLFLLPVPHYNVIKHLVWFDYNLYVYLYILIGGIFTASFLAINNEITFLKENKHIEYPLLILLVFLFGIVVVASENFIAIFLALEAITLISAVLIGFQRSNNFSTLAGIRYILFSAVPGGALLLGISELYAYTGAFNFADIEKLLMNYNDNYIEETSLIEISQILYNSLENVIYYEWDKQYDLYKDAIIRLDIFLKNSSNNFNTLIKEASFNSSILGQIINYEFDNSSKDNLEPITLSLLGSYILHDNTNYDDNIKVGKYYIYKYIYSNNYLNYSLDFLKEDKDVIEYCTSKDQINVDNPFFTFTDLSEEEAKSYKNNPNYFEHKFPRNTTFYTDLPQNIINANFSKALIGDIIGFEEEKKVINCYFKTDLVASEQDILDNTHPLFHELIIKKIDVFIKSFVPTTYLEKMKVLMSLQAKTSHMSDKMYMLDFIARKQSELLDTLEKIHNELNLNHNDFQNNKCLTFEDFQKLETKDSLQTYNQYFYGELLQRKKLYEFFYENILNDNINIDVLFLKQLTDVKVPVINIFFYDLYRDLNDCKNFENIESANVKQIFTQQIADITDNVKKEVNALEKHFNVHIKDLGDESSPVFDDILKLANVANEFKLQLYKGRIEAILNADDLSKTHIFKMEVGRISVTDLSPLENYKVDISEYLSMKDVTVKNGILNLVSVNHTNNSLPTIINISVFLIIFYILFKLTAAPFHVWAPSIYEGAPLPMTIFLSIFSKITMVFLLTKLLVFYFYFLYTEWSTLLLFSGMTSILVGIYGAIAETRLKRFFVYSSMGHVGFMLLGIAEGGVHGVLATIVYLMIYTVTVFIGWTILFASKQKITHINQLSGLSKTNPALSFILAISMLSMSGIPPLAGFYVKFEILYALVESEYFIIALFALLLTVFSFFYYLRIIKILYFEPVKKYKLQFKLNKTQAFLLALCFLFLVNFSLYFQQPVLYTIKNIIIQSLY